MDEKDERITAGDVHPGDWGLVALAGDERISVEARQWGMPLKKKLIINARSETLLEKPFFREDAWRRRCVIFARGFYEWNADKIQYRFSYPHGGVILMGGIYDQEGRYVIITRPANESVKTVHERMPLLLAPATLNDWLYGQQSFRAMLDAPMPALAMTKNES